MTLLLDCAILCLVIYLADFLILTDTRQQKEKHIIQEFDKQKILHIQTKLDSADYMAVRFKDGQMVKDYTTLIDTKNGLLEVAGNLCHTAEHNRVVREIELASKLGCKTFVFLIGQDGISNAEDIISWRSPHTRVAGKTLLKVMNTFSKHHNCKFIIVPKNEMGSKIIQLLS